MNSFYYAILLPKAAFEFSPKFQYGNEVFTQEFEYRRAPRTLLTQTGARGPGGSGSAGRAEPAQDVPEGNGYQKTASLDQDGPFQTDTHQRRTIKLRWKRGSIE